MAEQTLKSFPRRFLGTTVVVLLSVCAWGFWALFKTSLSGAAVFSGLALFGLIVFLALFNTRKKIPYFPLLRASLWLQAHTYLGYFSIALFFLHIDFTMPSGVLETVLAVVFAIVALSGIVGLVLSRQLPKRMTRAGETLIYEQIPRHREEIRTKVQKLVVEAEENCRSSTLSEFYFEHMRHYLEARPGLLHPFGLERRRTSYRLFNELEARMRYLSEEEKPVAKELGDWILTKENLDFQESSQRILKGWLFIHIPMTVSLILLGAAHGILALIYGGNA